jgi:guanine deaminase
MLRQMGEALNSANAAQPVLSVAGALYLATMGGANSLRLSDRVGNFAPGKEADFIVIDYRHVDPIAENAYNSPPEILSRLCYSGTAECIKEVYVRGSRIHENAGVC